MELCSTRKFVSQFSLEIPQNFYSIFQEKFTFSQSFFEMTSEANPKKSSYEDVFIIYSDPAR